MDDVVVLDEAKQIHSLLFALGRELLVIEDDPAADLPLAQMRVCAILHRGSRPMSALSRELGVSVSAMTQIADRLERARLVRRVAEGTDRRVRRLELTPRGATMMRRREETHVRRVLAALKRLSLETRNQVRASLETLVHTCAAANREDACAAIGALRGIR